MDKKGKKKAEPTLADVFLYGKDLEESDDEDFNPETVGDDGEDIEGSEDDESCDEEGSENVEEAGPSNEIEDEVKGLMEELEENGYPEANTGALRSGKATKSGLIMSEGSPNKSSAGPSGSSSKRPAEQTSAQSGSPDGKKPRVEAK